MRELRKRFEKLNTEVKVVKARNQEQVRTLKDQGLEYERRLIELNHAHEKAVEVQHTYISREVHAKDIDILKAEIDTIKAWKERLSGSGATADYVGKIIWVAIGGAATIVATYLFKGSAI